DLDGVLADTEPVHFEATRRVIAPAELAFEEYLRFVGGGNESFGAWIERTYTLPRAEFDERYTAAFLECLRTGPSAAMDGADAVVRAVLRRGLRVAVASMSRPVWVEATLRAVGLRDLVPLVVTAEEVERPKPAPDIYLHTAALLGVEPGACIAIEDSVHGVAAAVAAGMWVVQTRQGSIPADPQPGADEVIESFAEFDLAWLEDRPPGRRASA
ncbi:MAG: HAD family phosphatase, partial [Dehalococcoidia bacterium]